MSVIVGFTVIQVKVAFSLGVFAHSVAVDFEANGVFNGMKKRLAGVIKVEDGQDGATTNESSLFRVSDFHYSDIVLCVHFKLRVHIVPLRGWWQVNFNLGCGTKDGILDARVTNLGGNKDVFAEHELVV